MPPNVGSDIRALDPEALDLSAGAVDVCDSNSLEQRTSASASAAVAVAVVAPEGEGENCTVTTTDEAARFVKTHRQRIDGILSEHGFVLFRGFPLCTPEDFNGFVGAFDGFSDLSYSKSLSFAVRTKLCDRICTTNEGRSGGLTGIVSSPAVYERLQRRHPAFCTKLEREGVRYTVYAGPDSDPTKGAGRSWKSFFRVSNRTECEARMTAGGWTWEWGVGPATATSDGDAPVPSDFLKCTTPLLEAVKLAGTDGNCFFNQLIATTANALEFSRVGGSSSSNGYDPLVDVPTQEGIDECVRFGNGDPIPLEILLEAKDICEELAIDVEWQTGDVLLLSNYLMMHARRPWKGPEGSRKLLASLVREEHCTSFGRPLVA
eukprot:jgi/Psemu1/263912/estExt_Genewise1Plus.C_12690011